MSKRPMDEAAFAKVSKPRPSQEKPAEEKKIVKDSTMYNRLHPEQIQHLYNRVMRDVQESPQGCCYLSTLPLDGKGGCYPKSLWLDQAHLDARRGHSLERPKTFGYNSGAVVLLKHGHSAPDAASEVSHLCEHPWCVRPEHIIWESRKDNGKRKNCNTRTKCPSCDCGASFNPCKHIPQCLDMTDCACSRHRE